MQNIQNVLREMSRRLENQFFTANSLPPNYQSARIIIRESDLSRMALARERMNQNKQQSKIDNPQFVLRAFRSPW